MVYIIWGRWFSFTTISFTRRFLWLNILYAMKFTIPVTTLPVEVLAAAYKSCLVMKIILGIHSILSHNANQTLVYTTLPLYSWSHWSKALAQIQEHTHTASLQTKEVLNTQKYQYLQNLFYFLFYKFYTWNILVLHLKNYRNNKVTFKNFTVWKKHVNTNVTLLNKFQHHWWKMLSKLIGIKHKKFIYA